MKKDQKVEISGLELAFFARVLVITKRMFNCDQNVAKWVDAFNGILDREDLELSELWELLEQWEKENG